MDAVAATFEGIALALAPDKLLHCFLGVFIGTLTGVLPGVGSLAAVALLLPVSFHLDPTTALIFLAGVYYGAEYGGSITSILLNLPGTSSTAVTCLDGHPLARAGKAGTALLLTALASFVGGAAGIIALTVLAPSLAGFARHLVSVDYFAIMTFALVASATISRGSALKGLAMVVVGLMLGCVGLDLETGILRFAFGWYALYDGLGLVAIAMGLFGLSEIMLSLATTRGVPARPDVSLRSMRPTRGEALTAGMPIARGSLVGGFLGALPGAGVTIASFVAYAFEKRVARNPDRFGNGAIEGICAPEAANNAAAQTAFIPTLTLGIPGSASMAFMLGALMIHGIAPGPTMISENRELFWTVVGSFWVGNIMLLFLNIPLIGIWVTILRIPYNFLFPIVVCFICVGAFTVNRSLFDVWVVLASGCAGFALRRMGYDPAPLLIGFVLGPLLEENFRRMMMVHDGDWLALFSSVPATVFLALSALLLAMACKPVILRLAWHLR